MRVGIGLSRIPKNGIGELAFVPPAIVVVFKRRYTQLIASYYECRTAKSSSGEYTNRLRPTSAKYSSPAPNHTAQPYTPKR